jgi:hypothetical protein
MDIKILPMEYCTDVFVASIFVAIKTYKNEDKIITHFPYNVCYNFFWSNISTFQLQ